MGKIVKFCSACDEGFAEKFTFCPNCGAALTAFEMTPVSAAPEPVEEISAVAMPEMPLEALPEVVPEPEVVEPPRAEVRVPSVARVEILKAEASIDPPAEKFAEPIFEAKAPEIEPEPEFVNIPTPTVEKTPAAAFQMPPMDADALRIPAAAIAEKHDDGDFYITVIEEKNSQQRNILLLCAFMLMSTLFVGGLIYSLFTSDLGVASIDQDSLIALVPEVLPVEDMETEPPPKKDDKEGGGGGGGGREDPKPASDGRLVSQTKNPTFPPDAKLVQITNPDIAITQQTKGPERVRQIDARPAGIPGGGYDLSNGPGKGGGLGSGRGAGQGSGDGDGEGSGFGSGSGGGRGNGIGDGTGDGTGTGVKKPPPPIPVTPKPAGVTKRVNIISKPKALYTDAARTNNYTGVVRVKVIFLANGSIGGVSIVSGAPFGLTESALAAARGIKFEPAKRDGVPYTTSITIEYSFSMY